MYKFSFDSAPISYVKEIYEVILKYLFVNEHIC